jgi:hypothetical protein
MSLRQFPKMTAPSPQHAAAHAQMSDAACAECKDPQSRATHMKNAGHLQHGNGASSFVKPSKKPID